MTPEETARQPEHMVVTMAQANALVEEHLRYYAAYGLPAPDRKYLLRKLQSGRAQISGQNVRVEG